MELEQYYKCLKIIQPKKLYERLGFKVYGETETHYQMEIIK